MRKAHGQESTVRGYPLWAYAEYYGLAELQSEDFTHGRVYGKVHITNPFL